MYKTIFISIYFSFIAIFCLPIQAKEKHIYENGYLADIQIQQSYSSSYVAGIGSGSSQNIFYPLVKVNGITYVGQTSSKLKDWIVGQQIKVRFNKEQTTMYLKRDKGGDFGIEVVKRVMGNEIHK
jgi:hypothetical protein